MKHENKANIVFRITCPDCFNKDILKTDGNLITRLDKHHTKPEQPKYQHLSNCSSLGGSPGYYFKETRLFV